MRVGVGLSEGHQARLAGGQIVEILPLAIGVAGLTDHADIEQRICQIEAGCVLDLEIIILEIGVEAANAELIAALGEEEGI